MFFLLLKLSQEIASFVYDQLQTFFFTKSFEFLNICLSLSGCNVVGQNDNSSEIVSNLERKRWKTVHGAGVISIDCFLDRWDVFGVSADVVRVSADDDLIAADVVWVSADDDLVAADVVRVSDDEGIVATYAARVCADGDLVATYAARVSADAGLVEADVVRVSDDEGLAAAYVVRVSADAARVSANAGLVIVNGHNYWSQTDSSSASAALATASCDSCS